MLAIVSIALGLADIVIVFASSSEFPLLGTCSVCIAIADAIRVHFWG